MIRFDRSLMMLNAMTLATMALLLIALGMKNDLITEKNKIIGQLFTELQDCKRDVEQ